MNRAAVIVTVLCLVAFAVDNTAIAPQAATNCKPQATIYGAEAINIPQMLSYQGSLTDTLGQPVPDGNYQLTFRLYTQPSGGSAIWTEAQTIMVKNGLFSALLGAVTPITSVPDAGALYLSLQVAADPELSPRLRIASAAYSYLAERAANADLLQDKDTTALDARYVNEGQVSSVTSSMIVDGTIAAADLGQMGAASGQVMKWSGSAWEARNDSVGQNSGGTVTSVSQATGVVCSPNPITGAGTVGFDATYGDGRYVNVSGDSLTGRLASAGEVRSHVRGTFGANCTNQGTSSFAAGQGCKTYAEFCAVGGGYFNQAGEPSSYDSCATVCGGYYNFNGGRFTFIGGGRKNGCSYDRGVVCGGDSNGVNGSAGVVCGGVGNTAIQYGVVGGGSGNGAAGYHSVVVGGQGNRAAGNYSAAVGGQADTAIASYGGALSGYSNLAGDAGDDTAAVVCGGDSNRATGKFNFIGGGYHNNASNNYSTLGGGRGNTVNGPQATVSGGWSNLGSGWHSVVAGGKDNVASGTSATVSGGEDNVASASWSSVAGGQNDTASGIYATVGGGYRNKAIGDGASAVAGGSYNTASTGGAVCGGNSNVASDTFAFVGAGHADTASGPNSAVAGGDGNVASADCATVAGGRSNAASGKHSMVPGGYHCAASGSCSFAAGSYALAREQGTFVWSDSCGAADSVHATTANRWVARARGGVYFYTNLGMTTGSYLGAGANSWNSVSDSMTKENFRAVDKQALLEALAQMRVRDYNLKSQDKSIRHIGPVAQDFHNAFGFGESNTAINMEDADGVALAAIQALHDQNQQLFEQNRELNRRITELEAKLSSE